MRSTEVDHVLTQLAAVSRTENAKGSYEFVRDVEQPDRIVVLAPHGDTAEREHHCTPEHFTRTGASQIVPRLERCTMHPFQIS